MIKNFDIENLSSEQLEDLKKYILSLSEEEALTIILKFLDDDYIYMRKNTQKKSIS